MTTKTEPTPLELAQAAHEAAKIEVSTWLQRHRGIEADVKAHNAELETLAEQIRAARAAALRGDATPDRAGLTERERTLRVEREELVETGLVAQAESARAQEALSRASEAASNASLAAQREAAIARAAELDRQIDSAYARLVELLNARADIAEGDARMARLGYGGGGLGFDWQALPHGGSRSRIPFPGGW